jgi:cytochrome c oxidase assembly protein subunit 11
VTEATLPALDRRKRKTALIAAAIVAGMVGLAYASVPLYDLFCRVTGFGGTTQKATAVPDVVLAQTIRVRFDANTDPSMPWRFQAKQRVADLKIGESGIAFYEAYNPTDQPVTGTATFNVTPDSAGAYFNKLQCFCFTEQTLQPGQRMDMPVVYFVDPAILDDPEASRIKEITLSYTFYRTEPKEAVDLAARAGENATN